MQTNWIATYLTILVLSACASQYGCAQQHAPAAPPPAYHDPYDMHLNIVPAGGVTTDMVGGEGGGEFHDIGIGPWPVIGFKYRLGHWDKPVIANIEPLYVAPPNGGQLNDSVIARPGYVVAGITVNFDSVNVIAFKVIFARYSDAKVNMADHYESDWIGTPDNRTTKQLAGNGETVIGLFGRRGMNLAAVGLIVFPPGSTTGHVAAGAAPVTADLPADERTMLSYNRDLPHGAVLTQQIGAEGGGPFVHVNPLAKLVLGFHFTMGNWGGKDVVASFDPIFQTTPGEKQTTTTTVVAQEGYAVDGLIIVSDDSSVVAIQILFARQKNGRLDPTDTYKSDWIGDPGNLAQIQIGGHGESVIGIYGRQGMNLAAVGLVTLPPAAAPAAR